MTKKEAKKQEAREPGACCCPFCEELIDPKERLMCKLCGVKLKYCKSCNIVVEKAAAKCPRCGGAVG